LVGPGDAGGENKRRNEKRSGEEESSERHATAQNRFHIRLLYSLEIKRELVGIVITIIKLFY
jgi:hypothetical protein